MVGPRIAGLVKEAAHFGTMLWFTEQDQLNDTLGKLVETGKISMCYNLLLFLLDFIYRPDSTFAQLNPAAQQEIRQLYSRCLADWRIFKEEV